MTCIDALARFRRLLHSTSGVAATEFAMTLPFLLGLGLTGLEVANRAMVQMKISQLAVHVADNASRIGDTSTIDDPRSTKQTSTICSMARTSRPATISMCSSMAA